MDEQDFNQKCIRVFKLPEYDNGMNYDCAIRPDIAKLAGRFQFVPITEMHFHDSYDWSMLLAEIAITDNESLEKYTNALSKIMGITKDEDWWRLGMGTPRQQSEACLVVING